MEKWLNQIENFKICAETIVSSVNEALAILNENFQVVSANRAFYSLFKTSKSKIENHNFFDLTDILWKSPELKELLRKVISDNVALQKYKICQSGSNGEKTLLISAKAISTPGESELILLVIEDITKRCLAEDVDERAESQYKKFVEDSRIIIVGIDKRGKIVFVNKFAESVLGYNRHELIGKAFVGTIIPFVESNGRENTQLWQTMVQNPEQLYSGKNEGICKDGRRIIFSWNARAFFDSNRSDSEIIFEGNDITELERTRNELKKKNELLDTLLNFIPEGIIITNQDKVVLAASRNTAAILDCPLDIIVHNSENRVLSQLPLYWPDGQNKPSSDEFPLSKASIEKGITTDYELLFKQNGLSKTLSYIAAPIRDSKGYVIGAIGNFRDTTESNKLLKENLSQKLLLERIINYAPFVIALFKLPDYKFVFVNAEYTSFARGKKEPIGKTLLEVWPESRNTFDRYLKEVVKSEDVVHFEDVAFNVNRDKGPEQIYLTSTLVPVFSASQELENILVILQETTAAVQKRRMMEELLARDEALLSSMADGVMIHTVDGQITYMNPVAKVLHDFPVLSDKKISFELLDYNRNVIPQSQWPYSRALKGERFTGYEVVVINKHSGREWYASYNGSPVYNDKGELLFVVISALDITDRKKAELRLQSAQLKLQKFVDSDIVGIVIFNESGDLIEVNDYYLNMLGYSSNEFNQKKIKWNEITPPESLKRDYEAIRQLKAEGQCTPFEKQYFRKDGSLIWVLIGLIAYSEDQIIAFVIDISDHKKAEEALRKSEAQLRAVFDTVSEGILIFDHSGNLLLANKYEAELSRFKSPDEMMKNISQFADKYEILNMDETVIPVDQWPISRVLRGEHIRDLELIGRPKKTDEIRYFGFNAEPVFDCGGKQILSVVLTRDITARKKAEKQIKESEERFRGLFELSPIGVASLEVETGKYLLANEQLTKITGFSREELQAMSFREITHPQDREKDWQKFQRMAREEIAEYDNEKRYIRKNGEIIWVRVTAKKLHENGSRSARSIGVIQDITKRKEAELKLVESEELFRNLADNISQLVWMADPDRNVFWYNKRWHEFTGKTPEEMKGFGWKKVHHPEHVDRLVKRVQEAWKGEPFEETFPLRGKDGNYRWFLSRVVPIHNENGDLIRWIGTNTDITETREREFRIEEQKRTLEAILEFIPQGLAVAIPPDGQIIYTSRFDRFYTGALADTPENDLARIKKIKARRPGGKPASREQTPLYRALKGETISDEEWEFDSVQGKTLQTSVSAGPIRNGKNEIVGAIIAWRDISELVRQRKVLENQKDELQRAEREAQRDRLIAVQRSLIIEQEKRVLDTLVENVSTGINIIDKDGIVRNANTFLSKLIRIPKENIIGSREDPISWGLLDPNTLKPPHYQTLPIIRAMQEKRGIYDAEYLLKKDSLTRTIAISADPIIDGNGQVSGAVSAWIDITERKRIEKENAYQAARYQAVFNSITEGLILADRNGVVLEINPATYQMYPNIPELTNKKISYIQSTLTIYDENENEMPFDKWPIIRAVEGEKIDNEQIHLKFKSGDDYYVIVSGGPVFIGNESPMVILIFHDLTTLIKTEKELRSTLQKLQVFINANIIGFVTGTIQGKVTGGNDYYLKLTGFTREDMDQGKINWSALSPPEYQHLDLVAHQEVNSRGSSNPYVKELYRKDGSRIWVMIAIAAIAKDEIGTFILDISDRKNIEKQLSDERNFISAILSTQSAIVAIIDVSGNVIDLNQAFLKVTGYTLEEMKGKSFWLVFPERDNKFDIKKYESASKTSEPVIVDRWIKSKNGEMHFIRWRNASLKNENGNITHIIATGVDITDRFEAENRIKKLNADLRQYASKLEIINNELEIFSYSVSHDLKAPLNVITGFGQYIIDQYSSRLDPELIAYLSKILISSRKMNTLINDLLTLSRISRDDLIIESINLSDMVSSYLNDLQTSEPQRKAVFIIQKGIVVKADRRLLHLAVENLLNNSWKYCSKKEKTEIELGSIMQNGKTVFFIKDNGVGFNMKYAEKIFQPFQRLHAEREFKGTGIGLATVVRVMRRHNGRVWANAEIGKGATFYFTLEI